VIVRRAGIEGVRAAAAREHVLAVAAGQGAALLAGRQRVAAGAADRALDVPADLVALTGGAVVVAGVRRRGDRRDPVRVVDDVAAPLALEAVAPRAADEAVVALPAQ
jgi:hypothetical protein